MSISVGWKVRCFVLKYAYKELKKLYKKVVPARISHSLSAKWLVFFTLNDYVAAAAAANLSALVEELMKLRCVLERK